jgi:SAM-dependent methyltransferase
VDLHPLAANFASIADVYERGRPEYAPAVVGAMSAELGLGPGAPVLDLAAGTGKLTRALVAGGLDVVAVEPQAELRERLAASVGAERVRDGVAEAIPLDDGSVDAVTVADGFHWFDQPAALAEMRRVLRPGGGLALLTTYPDWSGASWADELGNRIAALRPEHPFWDGRPWSDVVADDGHWTPLRQVRVTTTRPADPRRVVDYAESMSFVAALPDAERARWLADAAELVEAGETPAEWPVHVVISLATLERDGPG